MLRNRYVAFNRTREKSCSHSLCWLSRASILALFMSLGPAWAQCRNRPPSPAFPPGVKITIRADKTVAEIARPFLIHIEVLNGSNVTIKMRDNWSPELDYELHVRDSKGKEAPLTDSGRQTRTIPIHGSGGDLVLAPGEKHIEQENLADLYSISVPGTYTVEVCREVYAWGYLYSNRISVPFVQPAVEIKSKR